MHRLLLVVQHSITQAAQHSTEHSTTPQYKTVVAISSVTDNDIVCDLNFYRNSVALSLPIGSAYYVLCVMTARLLMLTLGGASVHSDTVTWRDTEVAVSALEDLL